MLATVHCRPWHLPHLPRAAVSRHGRLPVPGQTIAVPMPGETIGEGAGTGQRQARRIIATAGMVTAITGTIG